MCRYQKAVTAPNETGDQNVLLNLYVLILRTNPNFSSKVGQHVNGCFYNGL